MTRSWLFGLLVCALGACSKKVEAVPEDVPVGVAEVAPERVDLRTFELDETPAPGALPGMWVRCVGGVLVEGDRRYDACLERSQTWVDVTRDRVALVATAAHASELEAEGESERFVAGRARIEVDLRALMARFPADEVAAETVLELPVRVRGADGTGDIAGVIGLATPRVLELLKEVEKSPLVFPGEVVQGLSEVPLVVVLGPAGASVRAAPRAPLERIEVVAIDRGEVTSLPACKGSSEARTTRPIALVLVERTTGKVLGERRWPAPVPACGADDPEATSGPTNDEIVAGVIEVLGVGKPRPWAEAAGEVLLPLPETSRAGLGAELRKKVDASVARREAVHVFWRVAGLEPNSTESDVVALVGSPVTRTELEADAAGERVMAQWPGGLAVVLAGARVESLTFSGADATKALGRESGAPALIGADVDGVLAALGRPSVIEAEAEALVMRWVIDAGAWTLGVRVEIEGLDAAGGAGQAAGRCTTLTVTWSRVAGDPAVVAQLGFDATLLPPFDPEAVRRLSTFLGVGPETGKDGLLKAFGKPTNVTPSAGGIESYAFGPHLGALVEAATGDVIEVWVVGAGRDALRSKQLDDPLLAQLGRPLKEVATALGRPSKVGDGFVSWAVETGPLTVYLEVQCAAADGWVCNELDVGWLKAAQ